MLGVNNSRTGPTARNSGRAASIGIHHAHKGHFTGLRGGAHSLRRAGARPGGAGRSKVQGGRKGHARAGENVERPVPARAAERNVDCVGPVGQSGGIQGDKPFTLPPGPVNRRW